MRYVLLPDNSLSNTVILEYLHLESFGVNFRSLTTVPDDVISFSSFCLRLWKSSRRLCAGWGARSGMVAHLSGGK